MIILTYWKRMENREVMPGKPSSTIRPVPTLRCLMRADSLYVNGKKTGTNLREKLLQQDNDSVPRHHMLRKLRDACNDHMARVDVCVNLAASMILKGFDGFMALFDRTLLKVAAPVSATGYDDINQSESTEETLIRPKPMGTPLEYLESTEEEYYDHIAEQEDRREKQENDQLNG